MMSQKASEEKALIKSIRRGQLDFFKSSASYSPLVGAEFQEMKHALLYATGVNYAVCNGVIESDVTRQPSEEEICSVVDLFNAKNLPFIWWSSAKILENKGFQFGGILTGIGLDLNGLVLEKPISPCALKIRIVTSESDLADFNTIVANAFGMDEMVTEQFLKVNSALMKQQEQLHFIAQLNDVPVGAVTLSTGETSAGIWNLATLHEYRQQGIGTALIHAALLEAKARQYDDIMAILMPKGMAWGLFTKLGFESVCEFPFYVYGSSADELEK